MHFSVSAHFRCRTKCARDARGKSSVCSFSRCTLLICMGKGRAYRGLSVCCSAPGITEHFLVRARFRNVVMSCRLCTFSVEQHIRAPRYARLFGMLYCKSTESAEHTEMLLMICILSKSKRVAPSHTHIFRP